MNHLALPISINELIHSHSVEWERIEFKEGWNPEDILHTMCAFANDFHNLGGGYIVVGIAEKDGVPVLPPKGIKQNQLDKIQKELLNLGHSAIQPMYHPISVPYVIDQQHVLVIWVPGGETRPYQCKVSLSQKKDQWDYYIRKPVEVRISPEELIILSFPGPDHSIKIEDIAAGKAVSRRYRNRRIGEFLKELELTEGRSTGIRKIQRAIARNGSPAPIFETDADHSFFVVRFPVHPESIKSSPEVTGQVTPEVTPEVARMLCVLKGEMTRAQIMNALGLKDEKHFREHYQQSGIFQQVIEMTIPDKPRSSKQKYRLTEKGKRIMENNSI